MSSNGIDAPTTVSGRSFEITVTNGATSVFVSTPNSGVTEHTVGADGKVTVPIPPNATSGTEITITDDKIPRPRTWKEKLAKKSPRSSTLALVS